jgi:hypothetical protein
MRNETERRKTQKKRTQDETEIETLDPTQKEAKREAGSDFLEEGIENHGTSRIGPGLDPSRNQKAVEGNRVCERLERGSRGQSLWRPRTQAGDEKEASEEADLGKHGDEKGKEKGGRGGRKKPEPGRGPEGPTKVAWILGPKESGQETGTSRIQEEDGVVGSEDPGSGPGKGWVPGSQDQVPDGPNL